MLENKLSWVEISSSALLHNLQTFKQLARKSKLMSVVKANAYGHGMLEVAKITSSISDYFATFSAEEALSLRHSGVSNPILVLGPTSMQYYEALANNNIRITCASKEAVQALLDYKKDRKIYVHVKVETGTYRQGLIEDDLKDLMKLQNKNNVVLEGLYTHYCDIEDTTDHSFAMSQLDRFKFYSDKLSPFDISYKHTACSAAAILYKSTYFEMIRVGISSYGLWPSKETFVSEREKLKSVENTSSVELREVMTWKSIVAQIKKLPINTTVGYGRTYKSTRDMNIAIIPVGYANGYNRALSNNAYVLINGRRANVCGRVMMNMIIVDVTDIIDVKVGDEVVLLGKQNDEQISADKLATLSNTINYEIVTRIEPGQKRYLVK